MDIAWTTALFNIINFLILVWLLKRFLYGPITRAMGAREQAIQDRLSDAKIKADEAAAEAGRYRDQIEALSQKEAGVLQKAKDDAEHYRQELIKEAQAEVREKKKQWEVQMLSEREAIRELATTLVSKTFVDESRLALKHMANQDLEAHMVTVFLSKLPQLSKVDMAELRKNIQDKKLLIVATSFDLSPEMRKRLEIGVSDVLGLGVLNFIRDKKILCGLELRAGSQIVGWGFDEYINAFQQKLDAALAKLTSSLEA